MWTRKKISELRTNANRTQGFIRDRFLKAAIQRDDNYYTWGQFLDEPVDNKQYGIYGTSAGIQVLYYSGHTLDHQCISGGCATLFEESSPARSIFKQKGDFDTIFKICFMVDASDPCRCPQKDDILKDLINRKIKGKGWGNYFVSEREKDSNPNILATAMALLSLMEYGPFLMDEESEDAVNWLCTTLLEKRDRYIYEVCFAIFALIAYKPIRDKIPEYEDALGYAKDYLIKWARERNIKQFGYSENYHFWIINDKCRANKYLLFQPDCLASIAFLKLDCPIIVKPYILSVINYYTQETFNKGFKGKSSDGLSTIDHLWIFRLMKEFIKKEPDQFIPHYLLIIFKKKLVKTITVFLLLIIGSLSLFLGFVQNDNLILKIVSAILTTISFGLLVQIILDTLKGN
jgi:hypothetical protein